MSTPDSARLIASSGEFRRVGSVVALRGGEPVAGIVDGQAVAVFVVQDAVIATAGICPHAEGPLHEGIVEGHLLTCPWHGWQFNLQTGGCEDDPCINLARYEVRIDGDDILVRV
ncbi:Rieske (2Fe-2S) protein [Pseudomonas sp. 32A]|uniref:Rieske (2Fe-2S) protein n=1 Tax=Pseudomonas sp. 32A TaxID=651185 RepID=UPI003A3F82BE